MGNIIYDLFEDLWDMTDEIETLESGAKQSKVSDRYDLLCPAALQRLAATHALGAAKYGDYNWTKGISVRSHLNHALQHIFKDMQGDTSEDHIAHALWRLAAILHVRTGCEHHKKEMESEK